MNRSVFSSDEVADIVFKIVGEIEPVGETNTDNARFSHLQTLLNTLDILIDEVTFVLPCENRYEYSMQRAGQEVKHWIKDKHQQFANLGEDEEPERKKGKWVNNIHDIPICNQCGYMTPYDRAIDDYEYGNYCPKCGAKMEGEEHESD